ncbi:MAG: methyltransferase domain-containing protein, partial [Anaerolineae bacterium]|nr:methyltransferase domain-containing protein [Anaerolineae bacterium]
IDPSMAFGTGTHPTTQLCLAMVERHLQPGVMAIDIGCGSGILSIAAVKLGAAGALAVDIDPDSVKATQQNAEMNGVIEKLQIGQGSVNEVLEGRYDTHKAPLVLVNILAPVILRLFNVGLADLVTPGGLLVLSGILADQEQGVLAEAVWKGFSLVDRDQLKDWVVLVLKK